jgi:hypothetical protein
MDGKIEQRGEVLRRRNLSLRGAKRLSNPPVQQGDRSVCVPEFLQRRTGLEKGGILRTATSFRRQSSKTLIFFAIVFSACNIFQTRTPQPPQQGQSSFIPATSPDSVIANLENAIEEEVPENYVGCLSDSNFGGRDYSFSPSSDVDRRIFLNWTKTSEYSYFSNVKIHSLNSARPALILSSQNSQPLGFGSDSVLFSANYTLLWPNTNYPEQVRGSLQFYLGRNNGGVWSIYRWVDLKSDTTTWSDLKAQASGQ